MALRSLLLPALVGIAAITGCSQSPPPAAPPETHAAVPAPTPDADIVKDATPTPAQIAAYPLKTCVISDETLGEDGPPYDIFYKGRLVRFCCDSCLDDFKKDPAKYLAKIDKAAAAKSDAKAAPAPGTAPDQVRRGQK